MQVAYAHSITGADGAPPEGWDLLAAWTLDPTFLVPLVVAVLYFRGLRWHRRLGRRLLPRWRTAAFTVGFGVLGLSLLSPVDALADYSFTWHMVQHMLLSQVGVPLLLLGAPFIPVVRGLPVGFRRRVFVPFAKMRAVRWTAITLTNPIVAWLLFVAMLWAWHYPTLYDAALIYEPIHYLEHFSFVMSAVFLWWNVITPYPFRSPLHHLVRVALVFVTTVQNSALGAMLTFSEEVWYAYRGQEFFWGMPMQQDQILGGAMMWVGGGMMYLVIILVILMVYAHQEEAKEPARSYQ